jgi:glycine/D-amino acid oxidase-like deaminating enzyme
LRQPSTRQGEETLSFTFEGRRVVAHEGETVMAALISQDELVHSFAKDGAPRGPYCGMGVCHDCIVTIDGRAGMRGCLTKVTAGMVVQRQPAAVSGLVDLAALPDGSIAEEAVELLVVGAGPGGLAAAQVAAESGASVLMVDERPAPGGQYFKQPAIEGTIAPDRQARDGAALIRAVRNLGVEIRSDTLVWSAFREEDRLVIGLISNGRASYVAPRILVVAAGAFERAGIFPGWTVPGVMTTGACQTLLRSYGRSPGRRILLAGNGPLNFQVACDLLRAGSSVAAVVEAAPPPWTQPATTMKLVNADPWLAATGLRQLATLRWHGVPVHWQHRLIRVEGGERAKQAVVADGRGRERSIAVDAVCVGEGFAPANELVRLLGCAHTIPSGATHAEVIRDDHSATSLPDVFVVGEAGGFGGAHIAIAQGRLAAAEAVRRIGRRAPIQPEVQSLRQLNRARRFQRALWSTFAVGARSSRANDDTIVCRCEALRLGMARRTSAAENVRDLATLKRLTRAGMGRCQGRYCAPVLAELIGLPAHESDLLAPQMPLRPVPLAALCVQKPEWGGHRRALLPPQPSRSATEPLPVEKASVVVIGAGIAGISTALFLARAGIDVVVLDRGWPNGQASGGNAGSLHAQLLSFDHGAKAEGGGSPAAKTLPLQRDSILLWQQLERELEADFELKITGGLMVAETPSDLAFLAEKTKVERAHGMDCDIVGAAELRTLEPALDTVFIGAAFCPQEGKINPLFATQRLLSAAVAAGARVLSLTNVTAIERAAAGFVVATDRGRMKAGRIVNAAGGFASEIGSMLSLDIPVFGAPLQMIVTEAAEPLITRLIAHADRHLTLKQAANGNFLIGGGWTAGLDPVHRRPRPLRASIEGNLWIAQHVVPALRKLHVIRSWAAMNIDIDGAPILGEHPAVHGFFNAVTSNGYTLGPLVGRITADLIVRGHSDRDIGPFSVGRFDRRGGGLR